MQSKNRLSQLVANMGSNLGLYTIIEQTPNGVLVVDRDYIVQYANPSSGRLIGFDQEEMEGMHLSDLLGVEPDYEWEREDACIGSDNAMGKHCRHEMNLKNESTGEERVVEVFFMPPPQENAFINVIIVDIDKRKRLEVELRRSNSFFSNLIDSSVDGIIAANMKGKIILFNQGAQELLGFTEEEAKEKVHVTKLYPEGVAYDLIRQMRSDDYGGKGKLIRHELMAITKDGRQIPMSLSGGIIYDEGEEIASFGIFTDLRKIQQVEEDLVLTHRMLQQSEKMAGLGRLAAGVAHEINNPMSGIMLYANLVKESLGEDHELAGDMETIIHEAERCKVIVADLLEFSHQNSYDMGDVDLNEVLKKALALLEMQPLFHNIELKLNLADDLCHVNGSATKLNQVFINIIVNSAQAMDGKGTLWIDSRNRSNGDVVEVTFRDCGPGISKDDLQRIFDPFYTTKEQGKGTGLGLSVAYAIVKEHKGTIRAASAQGEGATFTLKFPSIELAIVGDPL